MSEQQRTEWNQRFRSRSHVSFDPDPFVVSAYREFVQPVLDHAGSAVDLAGGAGRHAIWLAERSWDVCLIDISSAALELAAVEAESRGLRIKAVAIDLEASHAPLAGSSCDLLVCCYYLQRDLWPKLRQMLRAGGVLIYKTYTVEQRRFKGGPSHPLHLLNPNELLEAMCVRQGLRCLYYRETVHEKGVAELVARVPGWSAVWKRLK